MKSQCKLETKAYARDGQCIPAGYCHVHMRVELITM